ncbi:glycosyltransferase family 32 protein [Humitalea rosea]|uniref:glycosyltransferase family 32 protein n=1 Tax=Humitalea rosea TaxID=990373 RepID=UPI000DAE5FFF|nr:glycosyltransferase [Humitalea rosea]
MTSTGDPALDACHEAIEAAPGTPAPVAALGQLLFHRQAFRQAEAAFRIALALGSQDPLVHALLAEIAKVAGAHLTAARGFEIASDLAGGNRSWRFLAGNSFWELGWADAAMGCFSRLPRPLPDWWALICRNAQGGLTTARATARRLLPLLREARIEAGPGLELLEALTAAGRLRAAAGLAARLAADVPQDAAMIGARASLAFRLGGAAAGLAVLAAHPGVAGSSQKLADLGAMMAMEDGNPALASATLELIPRERWNYDGFARACRIRIANEDSAGLDALARDWVGRGDGWNSTPFLYMLEAFRQGGRLALLPETPTAPPPAGEWGLVQFWDAPVPPADVAATMASWRSVNPQIRQTILDLDAARAFIAAEHGAVALGCFDRCRHAAMKSDYLRLMWLFTHGGFYSDADDRCLAPVGPLFAALETSEVVVVMAEQSPPYFNNCLLGARRGSAIIGAAIAAGTERMLWAEQHGLTLSIWNDTGPGLLTRSVVRALMQAETPQAIRAVATVVPDYRLRTFTHNDPTLAYKLTPEGNWRLA